MQWVLDRTLDPTGRSEGSAFTESQEQISLFPPFSGNLRRILSPAGQSQKLALPRTPSSSRLMKLSLSLCTVGQQRNPTEALMERHYEPSTRTYSAWQAEAHYCLHIFSTTYLLLQSTLSLSLSLWHLCRQSSILAGIVAARNRNVGISCPPLNWPWGVERSIRIALFPEKCNTCVRTNASTLHGNPDPLPGQVSPQVLQDTDCCFKPAANPCPCSP